ncbi:MAG: hypothetical protein A3E80_06070 [Chlamydiae bacterium RIFCSPHIGHO2_12_FULL_49_9]|nr:MAG: hypothetical protein A3E80_06070 [Chlamydiae bacterium RIFCSPHIGHO2_12_FULL_49_9]
MGIAVQSISGLEEHLQHKLANHGWIQDCLAGKPESFPYRVKEDGKASLIDLIEQTAMASGKAIHRLLSNFDS